jgi:hypothetical protein
VPYVIAVTGDVAAAFREHREAGASPGSDLRFCLVEPRVTGRAARQGTA